MIKQQIESYLNGTLLQSEQEQLIEQVRNDNELDWWFRSNIETAQDTMSPERKAKVWQQVNQSIDGCHSAHCKKSFGHYAVLAGAVVVLMLLSLWVGSRWAMPMTGISSNLPVVVSTGAGEHSRITLPDGSKVTLNAMTTIRYDCAMAGGERRVKLEGEAFFDVAKDAEHPFVIDANQMQVMCLGTSLNVCNYSDDQLASVVLVEGKVRVMTDNGDLTMEPDSRVVCDKQSLQMTKLNVNAADYTCWLRGETRYNNQSLEEITRDLARNYHINFIITNDDLRSQRYTGFLGTCSLRNVLDILTITSNMSYKIDGDSVYIFARN